MVLHRDFINVIVHNVISEHNVSDPKELEKILTETLYNIFRSNDFVRFIRELQR